MVVIDTNSKRVCSKRRKFWIIVHVINPLGPVIIIIRTSAVTKLFHVARIASYHSVKKTIARPTFERERF